MNTPVKHQTIDWTDVREPVRRLVETLRRYHPRHTRERVEALRTFDPTGLNETERRLVSRLACEILGGSAREPDSAPLKRGMLGTFKAGGWLSIVAWFGLVLLTSAGGTQWDMLTPLLFAMPIVLFLAAVILLIIGLPVGRINVLISEASNNEVRAECAAVLRAVGDREALGPIARACREAWEVGRHARLALSALLSRYDWSEAGHSAEESIALAGSLPMLSGPMATRVLNTLAAHGTSACLPDLRIYARHEAAGDLAQQALRSVERMERRIAAENYVRTLLRPAGSSATLLRASEGGCDADPAQLLRPAVE
jgi:hypothetical protein